MIIRYRNVYRDPAYAGCAWLWSSRAKCDQVACYGQDRIGVEQVVLDPRGGPPTVIDYWPVKEK